MSRRRGGPWKHRPHHRAFARLSAAARGEAEAGFLANEPTTTIAARLRDKHGETIAVSSLNRYREWWTTTRRDVEESRREAEALVAALRDNPTPELEALISQLLQRQRLVAMARDRAPDATKLGQLALEEKRLALEERKIALRERALERRVGQAAGNVEKQLKRARLDDDTIEKIRTEIYGLAPRQAAS